MTYSLGLLEHAVGRGDVSTFTLTQAADLGRRTSHLRSHRLVGTLLKTMSSCTLLDKHEAACAGPVQECGDSLCTSSSLLWIPVTKGACQML